MTDKYFDIDLLYKPLNLCKLNNIYICYIRNQGKILMKINQYPITIEKCIQYIFIMFQKYMNPLL